jgi:two-component system cell cycle response regulator CpdR
VIILAEDDPSLRELLAAALELDGHEVLAVATGDALLEQVRRITTLGGPVVHVDLLIADVRMPGPDDVRALELLRRSAPAVPAILLTAFGDRWNGSEAAKRGALLVTKPIELWRLREIVRAQLAA